MTDYNIQMKQFNGGDYDNLYPATLASLVRYDPSSSLESTTIQDALTELDVKRPYIIKGSYVGNGNSGAASPSTLTFNRDIVLLLIVDSVSSASSNFDQNTRMIFMGQTKDGQRTYSYQNKTLQWFGSSADSQLNASGHTYFYIAIAEEVYVPYVGQTWVLTKNTTFVVPITGNYKLELHGGGGGGGGSMPLYNGGYYYGGGGGGSGELYNNVQLTKDAIIPIIIGNGGTYGQIGRDTATTTIPATAGQQGGTTSFGTYSIAGGAGGGAASTTGYGNGGAKSGSLAQNGKDGTPREYGGEGGAGGSGGSSYGNYGDGGSGLMGAIGNLTPHIGKSGAVIITYLGGSI